VILAEDTADKEKKILLCISRYREKWNCEFLKDIIL